MPEREQMEFDVVVVGAGPAGLACALKLKQLNAELSICVLEKAAEVGRHSLAGAVIETAPLDELIPHWRDDEAIQPPDFTAVTQDEFFWLKNSGQRRLPLPPQMRNDGNIIVGLGATMRWLAEHVEAAGVDIYPGFAAATPLLENGQVVGVRTGDMGLNKQGQPNPEHVPGMDLRAKLTVVAEGCRGSLAKQLITHFDLAKNSQPQTYGIGFKELWQIPAALSRPGLVQHTIGYPLGGKQMGKQIGKPAYGGGFIYHLDQQQVALGFVVGLDYRDPLFSPYEAFQNYKNHSFIKYLLEKSELVSYGSRALVEGGWQALPKLEMPGAVLVGDAAGTLNVPKIKGVHTAMQSGMLAAETVAKTLQSVGFDQAFRVSDTGRELRKVRNIRPGFKNGMKRGLANAIWETATAGFMPWTRKHHADHEQLQKLSNVPAAQPDPQQHVAPDLPPRDRLAAVHLAATEHDEDQPVHLQITDPDICTTRCTAEYGNPCTKFCPAAVYEMVDGEAGPQLQINAANCVHCKTCDIKDPYQVINWVPPEGGSGPNYVGL